MAKKSAAKTTVTYFDLDAVATEEIVIKLAGVDYPLVPVSVENFISNTRMIGALGNIENDIEKQLDLTTKLLSQAIPSMSIEKIRSLSMTQMTKLVELCHKMNGQDAATAKGAAEAEKAAAANPQ